MMCNGAAFKVCQYLEMGPGLSFDLCDPSDSWSYLYDVRTDRDQSYYKAYVNLGPVFTKRRVLRIAQSAKFIGLMFSDDFNSNEKSHQRLLYC